MKQKEGGLNPDFLNFMILLNQFLPFSKYIPKPSEYLSKLWPIGSEIKEKKGYLFEWMPSIGKKVGVPEEFCRTS